MIVAELALETERYGEASKEVRMPHQFSEKFFVKIENKNQKHQNSNLHHLYIAEILTKLRAIYDATLWKDMAAGSKISDRERFSRDPITPQIIYDATLCKDISTRFLKIVELSTAGRRDTPNGTLGECSIHDAITQQPQSIYDATGWKSITPGFKNQTQKSQSIYDAMVWRSLAIGDGIAPHPMLSMTKRHRGRYCIYDTMS